VFKSEQTTALTFVNGTPLGLKMNTRASPGGVPAGLFVATAGSSLAGFVLFLRSCNYSQQGGPTAGFKEAMPPGARITRKTE
jgi:hypothetical protein